MDENGGQLKSTEMSARGTVYVGKKEKGKKDPVISGVLNINATSGSMNKISGLPAKTFSPMLLGPVIEKDVFGLKDTESSLRAENFENYWQFSKVYRELGHIDANNMITPAWFEFRRKGFAMLRAERRPKETKTKEVLYVDERGRNRYRYYTPVAGIYRSVVMGYLDARKLIYIPVYAWLVSQTPAFIELKRMIDAGRSVLILDFDVIPGSHLVTVEFLRARGNDPSLPFGHGYVLAGLLANILPAAYC